MQRGFADIIVIVLIGLLLVAVLLGAFNRSRELPKDWNIHAEDIYEH